MIGSVSHPVETGLRILSDRTTALINKVLSGVINTLRLMKTRIILSGRPAPRQHCNFDPLNQ